MFAKIKEIEDRYDHLERELSRPEIIKDQQTYQKYSKEHRQLSPIIHSFREYNSIQGEIENNRSLLDDPDHDIRKLAHEEIDTLKSRLSQGIPMTRKISFSRSGPVPGARRQPSLPRIS
jgi:peptide chain release factor 1